MTTKTNGPSRYAGDAAEVEDITKAFLTKYRSVIDPVHDAVYAAAVSGSGDDLLLLRTWLRGLAADIEALISRNAVGVAK